MGIIIQIGQFLLSLSILIILHEMGHFIFARIFNTRVEKFYLFFDPWFSLFKYKKGDTEYGIGWLPLGGYVKISGMIDESMDKEQMKQPPQPWEFRSKPAGQRLLIMLGGVLVNLVLGFVIYAAVLYSWGEKYLPVKNMTSGVWCIDSMAYDIGFRDGDKILSVGDVEPSRYEDIYQELFFGKQVKVIRNNRVDSFMIPDNFIRNVIKERSSLLLYPRIPFIIKSIPDTSINKQSGLKEKDRVIAVNGIPVDFYDEYLSMADTLTGGGIALTVLRDGQKVDINAVLSDNKKLEVQTFIPDLEELEKLGMLKLETKTYSILGAIPAGFNLAVDRLGFYIRQFKLIFNFKTGAYKGLGGFGAIGGLFPRIWDWQAFWEITAFLSLILAFMNVLPIPALDGGHVIFLLYEIVTRRKPSDKFMEYAQITGMIIILALLVFANGNDLLRWLGY